MGLINLFMWTFNDLMFWNGPVTKFHISIELQRAETKTRTLLKKAQNTNPIVFLCYEFQKY